MKRIQLGNFFVVLAVLILLWFFPAQVSAQNQSAKASSSDSVAAAKRHLELAGAILAESSDGRVTGLQMPENMGLRGESFANLVRLKDLEDLDLSAMHLSNERVEFIGSKLTELRTLNLFGNPLDSISLSHLTGLKKLETLYLYRTFIDDEGMKSIAKLKSLKRLNVFDTFLTDEGLKVLGTCKQLNHLCIGNSKTGKFPRSFFTPEGIKRLRLDLPNTTIVYWGKTNDQVELPKQAQSTLRSNAKRIRNLTIKPPKVKEAPDLSKREQGSDWPRFLGPNGDGRSSEKGLNTDWKSKPPKMLWHQKIGPGFAAPSISNGRLMLYHRVRNADGPARFKERLACLNCETGESIWKVDYPTDYQDLNGYGDGPRSTPIIDENRVFILSPEGMLRCLQCVDGKLLWEVDLKADFNCDLVTYGVGTSPLIYGNSLLVIAGGKINEGSEACVIALDKRSGVFQYGVGTSAASYATPVVRTIRGRQYCFAFTRDGLLAFNPDNGVVDFKFPWKSNIAGSVNAATPVVVDDEVLISEAYSNGAAKVKVTPDGSVPSWQDSKKVRDKILRMHWATPVYHDGFLYACSGRHSTDGMLKCVDWKSGNTMWQQKVADRTSLMYFDGHLLSLGENGALTLIRASSQSYQELGRLDKNNTEILPSYPAWVAPVIARGLLYIRGKHELICYDLSR